MLGIQYLAGIFCSHIVIRSMEHGLCAESGKAMVIYVLHGLEFYSDCVFLNQLAKTGLSILDSRSVQPVLSLSVFNICSRYPQYKSLRGEAYVMYGLGVSVWVYPLSECLQYMEAGFQFNKQVCFLCCSFNQGLIYSYQSGNILWASYGSPYLFEYPLMFGMNLKNVTLISRLIVFVC